MYSSTATFFNGIFNLKDLSEKQILLPHRGSFVAVKKISEKKNVQKDVVWRYMCILFDSDDFCFRGCVYVCVCVCVCVWVGGWVRARARVCVCVCVCVYFNSSYL